MSAGCEWKKRDIDGRKRLWIFLLWPSQLSFTSRPFSKRLYSGTGPPTNARSNANFFFRLCNSSRARAHICTWLWRDIVLWEMMQIYLEGRANVFVGLREKVTDKGFELFFFGLVAWFLSSIFFILLVVFHFELLYFVRILLLVISLRVAPLIKKSSFRFKHL